MNSIPKGVRETGRVFRSKMGNVLVEHQPDDGSLVFYKPRSRHAVRDAYICYKKGRFVTSAMRGFIEMMVRK